MIIKNFVDSQRCLLLDQPRRCLRRLRVSLGLKPLRLDTQSSHVEKERQNHEAKKREEAEAQAAELRRKIEA